ncbi:hypothetical protein FQN54_002815 [Arachnomyces sp. PD_36]|nr:hypothetical protein FQN54_002815 [Arachnomyces sp. PD_36]
MEAIPFEEVVASTPFKFYVGPDRKRFYAHKASIKKLSQPLSVLLDGPMSEAQSGSAILEETEEHTFVRFCQFAYTGDYDPAHPEIILEATAIDTTNGCDTDAEPTPESGQALEREPDPLAEPGPEEPPPDPESWDEPEPAPEPEPEPPRHDWGTRRSKGVLGKKKKKGKALDPRLVRIKEIGPAPEGRSGKSRLWDTFVTGRYGLSGSDFNPRANTESCEEYTQVFLCHAQLYVFADKYDISSLRELSLYKLHQTLIAFSLYPQRVGDIVELIRYTYANTGDGSQEQDQLRKLVIHYAACAIEDLARDEDFKCLLEKRDDSLSHDIITQMLSRLPGWGSLGFFYPE